MVSSTLIPGLGQKRFIHHSFSKKKKIHQRLEENRFRSMFLKYILLLCFCIAENNTLTICVLLCIFIEHQSEAYYNNLLKFKCESTPNSFLYVIELVEKDTPSQRFVYVCTTLLISQSAIILH